LNANILVPLGIEISSLVLPEKATLPLLRHIPVIEVKFAFAPIILTIEAVV